MADYTDDWMHPRQTASWQANTQRDPEPFLIQREAAIICSFVGGRRPTEWKRWSSHKTREERDAALVKLRAEHPGWHLRPAREREIGGYREVIVEDEAADLVRRLMRLKSAKGKAPTPSRAEGA